MKLIKWQSKYKLKPLLKNPKFIWGSSALLGGALYFKVWLPLTNLGIPCPFFKVTGHYCPGCGITRAITALLGGDLKLAWHNNALLFFVPLVFIAYYTLRRYRFTKQAELVLYIAIGFALVYGLLRNLPAFSFLAPIDIE